MLLVTFQALIGLHSIAYSKFHSVVAAREEYIYIYIYRLIIEGMEIKKLNPTERANLQMGYEIDPIWDAITEKI